MRKQGSPFRGRDPSSGSRTSDPSSEFSRSSAWSSTSSSSSSSSSRNPIRIATEAFRSCFSSPSVRSAEDSFDDFNHPTHLTPSTSTHSSGSNYRNEMRRSGKGIYNSGHNNSSQMEPGSMVFTMADIQKATKNFSPNLKIGQGGSGTVYKGQLGGGTLVAVKRAKKNVYDHHLNLEFQNEIQTLQRIEHLNLVRYYGFLEHEGEKIIVVEYVPNGNLREHLDCLNGKMLDFATRLDIAIDVAHAITYLHMYSGLKTWISNFYNFFTDRKEYKRFDHPIIHRDIKSSNILLTENYRAKVADFGFAKLAPTDDGATHVSTQVKGTAGYLDPQYLVTYQLTEKSDVYSFGVLLVELVSGRHAIEPKKELKERITAKWAMNKFVEGNAIQALDPSLQPTPATNLAVEKIFELAWKCLAQTRKNRPSMRRCAEILWSIRKDYKELLSSTPLHQPSHPRSPSPKLR